MPLQVEFPEKPARPSKFAKVAQSRYCRRDGENVTRAAADRRRCPTALHSGFRPDPNVYRGSLGRKSPRSFPSFGGRAPAQIGAAELAGRRLARISHVEALSLAEHFRSLERGNP